MPLARVRKTRINPRREPSGAGLGGGAAAAPGLGGGRTTSLAKLGSAAPRSKHRGDDFFGTQAFFDEQAPGSFSRDLFGSGHSNEQLAGPVPAPEDRFVGGVGGEFNPSLFTDTRFSPFISFTGNDQAVFDPGGGFPAIQFTPQVPDEIAGIPGIGGSAQEWFNYVTSFEGGVIPPEIYADIVQTEANRRTAEEGRQLAIGRIETAAERLAADREAFANDPDRQLVTDLLRERAQNPQFSDVERAAAQNALSRAAAVADAAARAEAGGRGVGGGGLQSSRNAGLSFATASAGLGLSARFEALNREAQDRAISLLADFETSEDQLDLAYTGQQLAVDQVLAALENDRPLAEIDFLAFEALEFGKEVYAANEAYRQATLEAFERSQAYDWVDFVDDALGFLTAGGASVLGL